MGTNERLFGRIAADFKSEEVRQDIADLVGLTFNGLLENYGTRVEGMIPKPSRGGWYQGCERGSWKQLSYLVDGWKVVVKSSREFQELTVEVSAELQGQGTENEQGRVVRSYEILLRDFGFLVGGEGGHRHVPLEEMNELLELGLGVRRQLDELGKQSKLD